MSLGSQSNFLFGAASAAAGGGGLQIERSLRFNSGDSARLTRQPSSAGNRTTWTYSFWVKRSINALFYQSFLINRVNASYNLRIDDPTTPKFYLAFASGVNLTTTPLYRDPEAWMHVVIVYNSATTTSTDRLQLYVNGSRVTDFDSINYPTFNQFSEFNKTDEHGIGYFNANTGLDGYLTNVEFIDGRAVAPTDFGEFDDNGVWQPKEYTGTFASTVTQTPSLDGAMIIKADGAQMTGYVSGSGLKCLYTSSNGIDWTFQNREAVGPFQSDAKYLAIGASGTNDITFFPGNGESFTYAMYSATTDFTTQSDITVDTTSLSYSASGTTSYGANGFHLDFSDNSSASALGTDSSGNGNDWTVTNISAASGSISEATGALPLYNTTDAYGRVKGTGFRTDSNASALQIAVAGDSSDEVAYAIRGSGSALTLTNTSVTFNQTGKFYSDAYLIQNAGAVCQVAEFTGAKPGTSDFCVEFWINPTTTPTNSGLFSYGDYNTVGSFGIMTTGSNSLRVDMHDGVTSGARLTVANGLQANEWQHFALTRTGTNCVLYRNGVSQGSWTIDASADFTPASNPRYAIGNRLGLPFSSYNINSYFQDFRVYVGTAKYSGDFSIVNPDIASDNDSLLDSPTNGTQTDTGIGGEVSGNYATLNPLATQISGSLTLSNGNLTATVGTTRTSAYANFPFVGKMYYEVIFRNTAYVFGMAPSVDFNTTANTAPQGFIGGSSGSYGVVTSNLVYNNTVIIGTISDTFTVGDYMGWAYDSNSGEITIFKNGTNVGTFTASTSRTYFPAITLSGSGAVADVNFGQRPFVYSAPSGFKALCTANLSDPTIADGSTAMDVALYTGNGSTQTISGLGFGPDLVWIKNRASSSSYQVWFDFVRGPHKAIRSDSTVAEADYSPNGVSTFGTDSFTVVDDATGGYSVNGPPGGTYSGSASYVAWTWDAGTSTVSNTDGDIPSSVRANPSAGFSIVKWTSIPWTGSAANRQVGHGLDAAPALIITKGMQSVASWYTYHKDLDATNPNDYYVTLNTTDARGNLADSFGPSIPDSTTFGDRLLGYSAGEEVIAYCFAPVEGYSAFGTYTGNGLADGPFIYTGFSPRWILVKASTAAESWIIMDTARDPYNVAQNALFANSNIAETASFTDFDILSNGFKLRRAGTDGNFSARGYIYAAFAENPFKTARAR